MRHLAIIADGNRRWAASQNLPKEAGHAQGLNVIERCCEWAISRDVQGGARTVRELDEALTAEIPTPDAILRTGGEMRLSNFLLWQAAYAELFFSPTMFPALEDAELDAVLNEYEARKRNFGT